MIDSLNFQLKGYLEVVENVVNEDEDGEGVELCLMISRSLVNSKPPMLSHAPPRKRGEKERKVREFEAQSKSIVMDLLASREDSFVDVRVHQVAVQSVPCK